MKARGVIVVVLLWALSPGLSEATEDLTHALFFGHSVHAAQNDSGHDDSNPEHGCTGAVHICGCHSSQSATLASDLIRRPEREMTRLSQLGIDRRLAGVLSALEHVPRA